MIETKQQYERITTQMLKRGLPGSAEAMHETIEALREVARAAVYYKREKQKFLLGQPGYDKDGGKPLDDALAALPDWLME